MHHPRFQGENLKKNEVLYSRVEKLAEKHNCTTTQLALAWVNHQGDDVVPIPGKFHFHVPVFPLMFRWQFPCNPNYNATTYLQERQR